MLAVEDFMFLVVITRHVDVAKQSFTGSVSSCSVLTLNFLLVNERSKEVLNIDIQQPIFIQKKYVPVDF